MSSETTAITPEDLLAHAAWLQRLAARLVEASGAEDLVQDTFRAALRSPPAADRPVRPWLAQVLRNLVKNRARGHARWAARARRIAAADDAPLPTPEELFAYHEAQRLVSALVAGLAEPFRSTVLLCYGQGLAPSEVAAREGVPAGTVRWRLKRGLDDLRAALDARYGLDRKAWAAALAPLAAQAPRLVPLAPAAAASSWGAAKGAAVAAGLCALGWWAAPLPAVGPLGVGGGTERGAARDHRAAPPGATSRAPAAEPARGAGVAAGAARITQGEPFGATSGGGGGAARALAAAAPGGGGAEARAPAPLAKDEAIQRAMEPGNAPMRGDPKAPVTVVVFAEFQCPFCARVQATLTELLGAYPTQVRLVFKNLPLLFHENAAIAAEAALAAGEQGKFWPMHDRLFAHQSALGIGALEEHAAAIGLDVPKWKRALETKKFRAQVVADEALAQAAEIAGTPTFIVNGKVIEGAHPLSVFKEEVEEALAAAEGRPRPPSSVAAVRGGGAGAASAGGGQWDLEALKRAAEVKDAPSKGPADALVTIVAHSWFECRPCAQIQPALDEVLAAFPNEVRLVVRNLPRPSSRHATLPAEAALAAHAQGKFWAMQDRLFADQTELDRASLERHAAAVGLDMKLWKAALEARTYRETVQKDARIAAAAGIKAMPTLLFNGVPIVGTRSAETLKAVAAWAIARAKGEPAAPEPPRVPTPGPVLPQEAPHWPPPRIPLPDEVLGERLPVPLPIGDAPTLGSANAPVTVIYFNDLACDTCRHGKAIVDGLRATYRDQLRLVARPISPARPGGNTRMAELGWAAHAQGRFWEVHDRIYAGRGPRTISALVEALGDVEIDEAALTADVESGRFREKVQADAELFRAARLRQPPTFVVDGRRADGPVALVHLIEAALRRAGRVPPAWPGGGERKLAPGVPLGALLSTPQRFVVEPRDDAWAATVEAELGPVATGDLKAVAGVAAVRLECRTSLCRLHWRATGCPARHAAAFVRAAYGLGEIVPTKDSASFYFALGGGGALLGAPARPVSAAEAASLWKARRASLLFNLRTGRAAAPEELPLSRLPAR